MTTPPPEHSGPFKLEIGLDWFFDKFIRGVHGFATVSRPFGDYVASLDVKEDHIHVDYPEDNLNLAFVYPKPFWLSAVKRMTEVKRQSEIDRQARFARDQVARELQQRFAEREAEIQRILILFQHRYPLFCAKQSMKNLRIIVVTHLMGKGKPDVALKMGVDEVTIREFLEFPQPTPTDEEVLLGLVVEKPTEIRVI